MRIFLDISSFNSPTKSVNFYKMNLLPQYTMIYRWVRAGTLRLFRSNFANWSNKKMTMLARRKPPSRKVSSLRTRLVHYSSNRRCVNVNKWPLCI